MTNLDLESKKLFNNYKKIIYIKFFKKKNFICKIFKFNKYKASILQKQDIQNSKDKKVTRKLDIYFRFCAV